MSTASKSVATWIGLALTMLATMGMAASAISDYGALEQRVSSTEARLSHGEAQRERDSAEIQTIRIIVTRMCALTPGCRE